MLIDELRRREIGIFESFALGRMIYSQSSRVILFIVLLIGIPITTMSAIAGNAFSEVSSGFGFDLPTIIQNPALLEQLMVTENWNYIVGYYLIIVLIQVLFFPLINMAITVITSDYIYGKTPSFKDALLVVLEKGHIFVLAAIMREIVVFAGLMCFVIPGLLMYVFFLFYVAAVTLDDKGPIEALKYSTSLVKGQFAKIGLFILMVFCLEYSIRQMVQTLMELSGTGIVTNIISAVISTVINSVFIVVMTLLYINRREMKKAKDEQINVV